MTAVSLFREASVSTDDGWSSWGPGAVISSTANSIAICFDSEAYAS